MSYEEVNRFIKIIEGNPEFDDFSINPTIYPDFNLNMINYMFEYFEGNYNQEIRKTTDSNRY